MRMFTILVIIAGTAAANDCTRVPPPPEGRRPAWPDFFANDGICTPHDLIGFNSDRYNYRADLNYDDQITDADRLLFIHYTLQTTVGDVHYDFQMDSRDLIVIFQAGEYEDDIPNNSTYMDGDFDFSGDFDSSDLVAALQDSTYVTGASPIAVPEPNASVIGVLLAWLAGLMTLRNQKPSWSP